jgi:chaperonin GroES
MLKLDGKVTLTQALTQSPNIATRFSEEDRKRIATHVFNGYKQDKFSRRKWEKRSQAALNLALQHVEGKTWPWPGCSNVAVPLITIASVQFHAKSYPAIIPGSNIVQYRVAGTDPDGVETARAKRIGRHMSWQLLEEDESWEEQHDRLLQILPIVGTAFKKSYNVGGKNTSQLVMAQDLVLDYYAKSVENCQRKTEVIKKYRNDIYSGVEDGIYLNVLEESWYTSAAQVLMDENTAKQDQRTGELMPDADEDTPFTLLEQHTWLDLDGDGYNEPYIATIEYGSKCLLRLVARWDRMTDIRRNASGKIVAIQPTEYYTKYGFIPSPDGSIYDIGFGVLLGPLNESANSLINQLIDAGTMSNTAGGFLGKGAKVRGGAYVFAPFEWRRVDASGDDLRKNIFPLPVRDPSPVLFQLLSLIMNYSGRISGNTDTTVGENPGQNTPAMNMQTMVEEGTKVYNAIYKRIWRSMKHEFKKVYILNAVFMPTVKLLGTTGMATRDDYMGDPSLIAPAADPYIMSEGQRLQQAMLLKQNANSTPGYNQEAIERNFLDALRVKGVDQLYKGLADYQPQPSEKLQIEQMRLGVSQMKLKFDQMKFMLELQEERRMNQAKIVELSAKASLEMEQAGGVKEGHRLAAFDAAIGAMKVHDDMLSRRLELMMTQMEAMNEDGGGVGEGAGESPEGTTAGLERTSGDQGTAEGAGGQGS